jgi:plastocyanin
MTPKLNSVHAKGEDMSLHKLSLVAGGLAVVLAACTSATPEPAPDLTSVPPLTEEKPMEEPTEEAMEEMAPSVTVSDQDASDGTVTIEKVIADQPGWLVIHITRNGAPGPVIGQSPVAEGSNANVEVAIDLDQATQQLFAMLHLDAGTVGVYEFPGDDAPVFVDDVIVNVTFKAAFPAHDAVTASDQAAADGMVTVDLVSAQERGWIVIHAQADGAPGPVIGFAAIEVGNNANVAVEIDIDQATETLYAMLHLDLAATGEYEFPGDDAPVFDAGGNVVLAPFTLLEAQASIDEEVIVIDSTYRMKVITVPVGTTVTWVYDAGLPHTVTSDTNVFNSGTMGEGDTFSFTFDEAGVFPYFCRFHGGAGGSGMSGIVNVTEG